MQRDTSKRASNAPPSLHPGFTLIELLVVVAIIAVLAALLLPAILGAKLKVQEANCLSNTRQVLLGSQIYINDTGSLLPYNNQIYSGGEWVGTLTQYEKQNRPLICPTAPLHKPTPLKGNRLGGANQAWVRWTPDMSTMYFASYAYNAWLYSDLPNFRRQYFGGTHESGGFGNENGV